LRGNDNAARQHHRPRRGSGTGIGGAGNSLAATADRATLGQTENSAGKAAMMKSFVRAGLSVSDRLSRIWRVDGRVKPGYNDGQTEPQGRLTAGPNLSRIGRSPRYARSRWKGRARVYNLAQPEAAVGSFFIWIRHNPLKSPESAKGIQGNASHFPWIYLV
jgi:hypothetical protein